MSARLRTRLGESLLALYPDAWRRRYAEEMKALLEDDPPTARGLGSLLGGAASAHVRPRRPWSAPTARARGLSLSVVLACWLAVSIAGVSFQKTTEDYPFSHAARVHALLAVARGLVIAGAALGTLCLAAGGLPLLWQAGVQAARRRERALVRALVAPPLAAALFVALTGVLFLVAPSKGAGFPARFVLDILLPWTLAIVALALTCALCARTAMRQLEPSARSLRRACRAGWGVAAAMLLVAAGLALYAPALLASEPSLAAQATGPYGAATGAMLVLSALGALGAAALGTIAALRANRPA